MAKYFSGISLSEGKFTISIIDDNLNIIFTDALEADKLHELLKRKSITTISIDAQVMLYAKCKKDAGNQDMNGYRLKKRSFDNLLGSRNMMTYQDRFSADEKWVNPVMKLYNQLNDLGFAFRMCCTDEKSIVESYPDTSIIAMGYRPRKDISRSDMLRRKVDLLRDRGIRIKDYLKRRLRDGDAEINTLIQAYTAYLYHAGECTAFGSCDEGILAVPGRDALNRKEHPSRFRPKPQIIDTPSNNKVKQNQNRETPKPNADGLRGLSGKKNGAADREIKPSAALQRPKDCKVMSEYCGAQYLYTNVDGSIRINDLRPIKSYRPFTEIYEIRSIKQVQVIMCTTDGLRKVKANLIPYSENSDILRAADDEDKRKLDSFWGNHGDMRGYLIKFNKVDVIKA